MGQVHICEFPWRRSLRSCWSHEGAFSPVFLKESLVSDAGWEAGARVCVS